MSVYAIKDTTLTALGDAIRNKYGYSNDVYYNEIITLIGGTDRFTERVNVILPYPKNSKVRVTPIEYGPADEYYEIIIAHNYSSIQNTHYGVVSVGYNNTFPYEVNVVGNNLLIYGVSDSNHQNKKLPKFKLEVFTIDENTNVIGAYTPLEMAEMINNLPPALPDEAFTITGQCQNRLSFNGWNWFINMFGDKIQTVDILNAKYMFGYSDKLERIPFDINFGNSPYTNLDMSYMFYECAKLREIPALKNCVPFTMDQLFKNCVALKSFPEDFGADWDFTKLNSQTSGYSGNSSAMFYCCYSLRKLPMKLLEGGNPYSANSYAIYSDGFYNCYSLDEIVNLPNPHYKATWTNSGYSSPFRQTFNYCCRLKEMTFAPMKENPMWSNQTIDLTTVGYVPYNVQGFASTYINGYAEIPESKKVVDDASYQALKDDPDWYTFLTEYSRYNHDSAVNTINSLPDTTATGSNTIKFLGNAGALTDGGAINTLTDTEIAVAAAKGWTVAYA